MLFFKLLGGLTKIKKNSCCFHKLFLIFLGILYFLFIALKNVATLNTKIVFEMFWILMSLFY